MSSQISSENKLLISLVEDYNVCQSTEDNARSLLMKPSFPWHWNPDFKLLGYGIKKTVNPEVKDIMDSYLMLCCSSEDMHNIKGESSKCCQFP